jgi:hypothetical protein
MTTYWTPREIDRANKNKNRIMTNEKLWKPLTDLGLVLDKGFRTKSDMVVFRDPKVIAIQDGVVAYIYYGITEEGWIRRIFPYSYELMNPRASDRSRDRRRYRICDGEAEVAVKHMAKLAKRYRKQPIRHTSVGEMQYLVHRSTMCYFEGCEKEYLERDHMRTR